MSTESDTLNILPQIQTDAERKLQGTIVKPSPELIPDEYEHNDNAKGLVYIFSNGLEIDVNNIKEHLLPKLKDINFNVTDEKNALLYRDKNDLNEGINSVLKEIEATAPSCLLIFFYGRVAINDYFILDNNEKICTSDILNKFTADKCPGLQNKPKIFIFEGRYYQQKIRRDSFVPHGYELPAEADILFVFKLNLDENDDKFLEQFCNNMLNMGAKEDIKTLITLTDNLNKRPLLISTLTRKFYLIPSDKRGFLFERHRQNQEILKLLTTINN